MRRLGVVVLIAICGCREDAHELSIELGTIVLADAGPPPQVTTTGCWSSPVIVGPENGGAIGVLPSGDALVMWHENEGLFSRVLFLDGGRSAATALYRLPPNVDLVEETIGFVRMSINDRGGAAATWDHMWDGGASRELLAARFDLDAGWTEADRIGEGAVIRPMIGIDDSGQVTAVWIGVQNSSARGRLTARRFTASGWSAPEVLSSADTQLSYFALSVSREGLAVLGWYSQSEPTFDVQLHATSWVGGLRADALVDTDPLALLLDIRLATEGTRAVMTPLRDLNLKRLQVSSFENGNWTNSTLDAGFIEAQPGFDELHRASVWLLSWDQMQVGLTHESATGWVLPQFSPPSNVAAALSHSSNGRGRSMVTWSTFDAVFVRRPEALMDDSLTGVRGARDWPQQLAIGPSGVAWLLARESQFPWRLLAFNCR